MKTKTKRVFLWLTIIVVCYGIYLWLYVGSSLRQSKIASDEAKQIFYSSPLNNEIYRVAPLYGDSCYRSFYIKNYPKPTLIVDVCRYPALKEVLGHSIISKSAKTNECTFIHDGMDTISLTLKL